MRCAGIVLVRQRPGEGKAIFITLSDETGVANVVVWVPTFERFRREVMGARLLLVEGKVQKSPEGVVHLMARKADRPQRRSAPSCPAKTLPAADRRRTAIPAMCASCRPAGIFISNCPIGLSRPCLCGDEYLCPGSVIGRPRPLVAAALHSDRAALVRRQSRPCRTIRRIWRASI